MLRCAACRYAWLLILAASGLCAPVSASDWQACAKGLEYRLSRAEALQGGVVLVEVRGVSAGGPLSGRWGREVLRFWAGADGVHRALAGVDLAAATGASRLHLVLGPFTGPAACSISLAVKDGRFAEERLSVANRFVEPSEEEQARAAQEAQVLGEIWGKVSPERLWSGPFRAPLDGIKSSGNFGKRRWFNNQPRSPHTGEDFPAAEGAPVLAAQRGRVVLAHDFFFSGNTVVLDHGLGLFTLYAHLSAMHVQEGDLVEAGATLGKVGATGRVTGAHLHWAARLGHARVNPLSLTELP